MAFQVHGPYPADDSYFKSRVLYPPASLYRDLAAKAECVVLGSAQVRLFFASTPPPPRSKHSCERLRARRQPSFRLADTVSSTTKRAHYCRRVRFFLFGRDALFTPSTPPPPRRRCS